MAQKIIVFEGEFNKDILTDDRVAGLLAKGYAVKSMSAVTIPDRKPYCYLLLENAAGSGAKVDGSDVSITGNWLGDYSWTQSSTNKPLEDLLHIICGVIDTLLTKVEGKMYNSAFYAVDERTASTITYKEVAETGAANKIYIDVNDGNKLYRYDTGTSAYVQIATTAYINDDADFDPFNA